MIHKLLIALSIMASPALAEPFSHNGYTLGCDEEGCTVFAAGFLLSVANDGSTPARIISNLANLDMLTAVNLKGDLGELGDATAPLTLTGLSVKEDDPYQDTLRYIQGTWKPKAEEALSSVQIYGLQWQEISAGEVSATFLITPGETCADGTAPGGIALSLYLMGGDPAEAACWQVEYATDTELTLRDFKGDKGQVTFERPSN
jgi:hypothetical protein